MVSVVLAAAHLRRSLSGSFALVPRCALPAEALLRCDASQCAQVQLQVYYAIEYCGRTLSANATSASRCANETPAESEEHRRLSAREYHCTLGNLL